MKKSPLLEKLRTTIRVRHYSYRTEKCYVHWVKRFILFHDKHHPTDDCGANAGCDAAKSGTNKCPNYGKQSSRIPLALHPGYISNTNLNK